MAERKKFILNVPPGIRYMSQWKEFKIPDGPHIMDKEIPGCGFTEYCLTNSESLILCSPRKILLQNKADQHPDDIFLVKTILDRDITVDKDLQSRKLAETKELPEITQQEYKDSFDKVYRQASFYIDRRIAEGKPLKIITTYDSFGLVKRALMSLGKFCLIKRVIIDEFQSIFTDSKFKADVEMGFVKELDGVDNVCYLSATPMMEPYLILPPFDTMDYYELNWEALEPTRVSNPHLKVKVVKSITSTAVKIIKTYLSGEYETVFIGNKKVESKEAVFYVNSVNNICLIIKKCGLKPDQVNILIANTPDNNKRLHRKLGRKFNIGKVPLKNEQRKMFTFCTRTVYLGADFYSDNARTFVLSDANIDTLAVDISLDLPQILGRQRLDENPWKNEAEFYYIQLTELNQSSIKTFDIDAFINNKRKRTEALLRVYGKASDNLEQDTLLHVYNTSIRYENYKDNYVGLKNINGVVYPAENKLVEIAERRGFDIQKIDYQDRFHVFSSIDSSVGVDYNTSNEIHNFFSGYTLIKKNIQKSLRYYCEREDRLSPIARERIKDMFSAKFKSYLGLGKEKLKALEYIPEAIEEELNKNATSIDDLIYSKFKEGDEISKTELKNELQKIYDGVDGYKRKAKATDIQEWFECKDSKMKDDSGKRVNTIKLIKKRKV